MKAFEQLSIVSLTFCLTFSLFYFLFKLFLKFAYCAVFIQGNTEQIISGIWENFQNIQIFTQSERIKYHLKDIHQLTLINIFCLKYLFVK